MTTASKTQVCNYPTPGTVTSKVTVTGGSVVGTGSINVTVNAMSYTVSLAAVPSSLALTSRSTRKRRMPSARWQ